jgi:hypothetical protein
MRESSSFFQRYPQRNQSCFSLPNSSIASHPSAPLISAQIVNIIMSITNAFYVALLVGLPPMKTLLVNLTPLSIPQNSSVSLIFKVIYMRLPCHYALLHVSYLYFVVK